MKRRVSFGAVLGAMVSVGALLAHPEVLALLPERFALWGSAAGICLQAVARPLSSRE